MSMLSEAESSSGAGEAQADVFCDESKCRNSADTVTLRYWWMPPVDQSLAAGYSCWAPLAVRDGDRDGNNGTVVANESNGEHYPCADGYVGRPTNVTKQGEDEETIYVWYTCCPPDYYDSGAVPERTCVDDACAACPWSSSNCWAVPDGLAPRRCGGLDDEQDIYKYPRDTGAYIEIDHGGVRYNTSQFLCCTAPEPTAAHLADQKVKKSEDLLPDSCSDQTCTSLNGVGGGDCWADGVSEPFTCNKDSEFRHPSRNGHDDLNMFNFHYVCCNTTNYYANQGGVDYWDGLHVALVIQGALSFITFVVCLIFTLGILSNRKLRSQGWNVYLVLLSVPDVVYNVFRFGYSLAVVTTSNTFVQTTWGVDWFYAMTNLLLNCVIVFHVHRFLRALKRAARIAAPTVKSVVIEALAVYLIAAACGAWMFYFHIWGNNKIAGGSHYRYVEIHKISSISMIVPPIFFVACLSADVWFRKLLPTNDGRMRSLALYFLRVILVFMATWLPYMILMTYGLRSSRLMTYVGLCLSSIQGSLSVAVALSKPDVKIAVTNFLKCKPNAPLTQRSQASNQNVHITGLNLRASTLSRLNSADSSLDVAGGRSQRSWRHLGHLCRNVRMSRLFGAHAKKKTQTETTILESATERQNDSSDVDGGGGDATASPKQPQATKGMPPRERGSFDVESEGGAATRVIKSTPPGILHLVRQQRPTTRVVINDDYRDDNDDDNDNDDGDKEDADDDRFETEPRATEEARRRDDDHVKKVCGATKGTMPPSILHNSGGGGRRGHNPNRYLDRNERWDDNGNGDGNDDDNDNDDNDDERFETGPVAEEGRRRDGGGGGISSCGGKPPPKKSVSFRQMSKM